MIATSIDAATASANCAKLAGDFPRPNVKCLALDLSTFANVKTLAAEIAADNKVVDVLVNVAATMVSEMRGDPPLSTHISMI